MFPFADVGRRIRVGNEYRIAGTFYGALEVSGGSLRPLVNKQNFATEYLNVPAAQAMTRIAERFQAVHHPSVEERDPK